MSKDLNDRIWNIEVSGLGTLVYSLVPDLLKTHAHKEEGYRCIHRYGRRQKQGEIEMSERGAAKEGLETHKEQTGLIVHIPLYFLTLSNSC